MYLRVLACMLLCISWISKAQQYPILANFMNDPMFVNPAAAGMLENNANLMLFSRFQWGQLGEGAPQTYLLSVDKRFVEKKMAAGMNVWRDQVGGYKNTDIQANGAYQLDIGFERFLSFGMKATYSQFNVSKDNSYNVWDLNDEYIEGVSNQTSLFKIGSGIFYSSEHLYAGVASPDLFISDKDNILANKSEAFLKKKRNYIAQAGARIALGSSYQLTPNIIFRNYYGSPSRVDVNLNFVVVDYFSIGGIVNYVSQHAQNDTQLNNRISYAVIASIQMSERSKITYTYDLGSKISSTRFVSHEIGMIINLEGTLSKLK